MLHVCIQSTPSPITAISTKGTVFSIPLLNHKSAGFVGLF